MATNLTNNKINITYNQLLHVDGGITGTPKTVYDGVGEATALKVGTGSVTVDNLTFDGSAIGSTDTVDIAAVNITGGTIAGITDLAIADGGTGASTAGGARTNLGLGTMATQDASSVAITGGSIQNVTFTGSFSGITSITSGVFAATSTLGYTTGAGGTATQSTSRVTSVTLHKICGTITLAAGSLSGHEADEFQFINNQIGANDVVIVNIKSGAAAATRKYYTVSVTSVSAGSCTISIGNNDNGALPSTGTDTLVLSFAVIKGVTS